MMYYRSGPSHAAWLILNAFRQTRGESLVLKGKQLSDRGYVDLSFEELYLEIRDHSVVSRDRLEKIYDFLNHSKSLPGQAAELGVYRGGTAKLIARMLPRKRVYLFDTFEGLPEIDPTKDVHWKKGDFAADLSEVKSFLDDCENVELRKGLFPDSAAFLDETDDCAFAFVYFDGDLYDSAKHFLERFYNRMVTGGVIMLDDYEDPDCVGVKMAVDEFLLNRPEVPFKTTPTQCVIIKK